MHINEHHVKKSGNNTSVIIQKLSFFSLIFVEIQSSSKISSENLKKSFAALNIFSLTSSATFSSALTKLISSQFKSKKLKKSTSTLKTRARTFFRISRYSLDFYMIMKELFRKFKRARRYTRDTESNTRAFSALIKLQVMMQTAIQTIMQAVF